MQKQRQNVKISKTASFIFLLLARITFKPKNRKINTNKRMKNIKQHHTNKRERISQSTTQAKKQQL